MTSGGRSGFTGGIGAILLRYRAGKVRGALPYTRGMSLLRSEILRGARNSLITNALLLPVMVSLVVGNLSRVGRLHGSDYWLLAVCGIVALVNVILIVRAIRFRGNPELAPAAVAASRQMGLPLDQVSARVEAELQAMPNGPIFSGVRLLPSFLYRRGAYGFKLIPID